MNTVKVGVIGLGNIGSVHAGSIYNNKISGLKLTAVCDTNSEILEIFSKQFVGVECYSNYKNMLRFADIDAVIIATPHYFHPEIAVEAFKNQKNVLTEKPAGVSATDVKIMNNAAKQSKKVFAIMFNQRTGSLFKQLKNIITSNELGEIKRVTWNITKWYRTQKYYDSGSWRATWVGEGGGVLMNQAPHNLDILQWIFGMPEKIFADLTVGKYHNIEVEDDAQILMKYSNGLNVVFITSTGEAPGTNRLEVSGSKGKVVLENGVLKKWISEQDERKYCFESESISSHINFTYSEITAEDSNSGHMQILQNFANAINGTEPLIADGTEGLNEVLISNAAYLSSWKGGWVSVNTLPEQEYNKILQSKKLKSKLKQVKTKTVFTEEYKERWG